MTRDVAVVVLAAAVVVVRLGVAVSVVVLDMAVSMAMLGVAVSMMMPLFFACVAAALVTERIVALIGPQINKRI